ncbi:MAG: poly[(R)-3-hydroxyalkanoate] polymerase subunit PhaC [Actinomycetota bacterium]|nr:poly[(R)-3-hydroxyalkanoate] polymerase subunit PhaC [Actinomycetota bacterium]
MADEAEEAAAAAAEAAALAADTLGPEAGLLAGLGRDGFARALEEVAAALWRNPFLAWGPTGRYAGALAVSGWAVAGRSFGLTVPGAIEAEPGDRRFRHPSWESDPRFFGLKQLYLAWSRYLDELVDAAGLDRATTEKARFAIGILVDALAPTNFLWTNPAALRRAFDTGGRSVIAGLANFLRDVETNGGRPRQVDSSAFRVGENLAATPGKVVFRNDLMELIQYSPTTDTVHEVPLLLSPPWINKYYIMDLAPGRSFAEYAVAQGHTVFAISYRNPPTSDEEGSMADVALDDYLLRGPYEALDVIADITGADSVNIVGLCLGGTLTTMLLAHQAAGGRAGGRGVGVRSATLLNTLVDFAEPGPMGQFLDKASVEKLSEQMLARGYLEASEMSAMFDLLRPRDLIWNYVESGWLMGEPPPAFDILAWNADGTRMPADMHSFYLRCCYVENQLARGEMILAGTRLDLSTVTADAYVLSAVDDHIAPWRSAYATVGLLGGETRFVLTSSGHVAGIVNPPDSKRRRYWTNEVAGAEPEAWREGAAEHPGSWWGDWAAWIGARAGAHRPPPAMGSNSHPALDDAPGTYVHEA